VVYFVSWKGRFGRFVADPGSVVADRVLERRLL
jgi:hypothetical protein